MVASNIMRGIVLVSKSTSSVIDSKQNKIALYNIVLCTVNVSLKKK